jgi:hypothetical protein
MFNKIFPIFFFLLLSHGAFSQDIIITVRNDSIRAKVIEITADKIRFLYSGMQSKKEAREIHKNQVKQIIYEDGSKLTVVYNRYEISKDMMIDEKFHVIKVDIGAPFFNHYTAGYEMKIRKGLNAEVKGGFIGSLINKNLNYARGYFVKGGVKFVKTRESFLKSLKYVQPMNGTYVKPELIFGQFLRSENGYEIFFTNYVINFVFGRQYVYNNFLTFEYFGGLGYGFQEYEYRPGDYQDKEGIDFTYSYSHLFFGKKIPIVVSGGITVGIAH